MVDKKAGASAAALCAQAGVLLPRLPWGANFDKPFQRPTFAALQVLTFASNGPPLGINIPNYDDVRAKVGNKNVQLDNVVLARDQSSEPVAFIKDSQQVDFKKYKGPAFDVQVGCHELLGHGSGKVIEGKGGMGGTTLDFENPLTNGKNAVTFYGPGETYSSRFGALSSAWEECRAEAVGLFLCFDKDVANIYGWKTDAEKDILIEYNWLAMAHSAIMGLERFDPKAKKWGQAHSRARCCLLHLMISTGCVVFENLDDAQTMTVTISSLEKVKTAGRDACAELLKKLNIWKALGDIASAEKYFNETTIAITDVCGINLLTLREHVIKRKRPRPIFCQAHTRAITKFDELDKSKSKSNKDKWWADKKGGKVARRKEEPPPDALELIPITDHDLPKVALEEFDETMYGMIQSMQKHYEGYYDVERTNPDFFDKGHKIADLTPISGIGPVYSREREERPFDLEVKIVGPIERGRWTHATRPDGEMGNKWSWRGIPDGIDLEIITVLVGDSSGTIRLHITGSETAEPDCMIPAYSCYDTKETAEQGCLLRKGNSDNTFAMGQYYLLRGCMVEMIDGFMHLCNRHTPAGRLLERRFEVDMDPSKNMSETEYALIDDDDEV